MKALEPLKNYTKVFSSGFVTNEIYLMAGKRLWKYNYQKSFKSEIAANDNKKEKYLWLISV